LNGNLYFCGLGEKKGALYCKLLSKNLAMVKYKIHGEGEVKSEPFKM